RERDQAAIRADAALPIVARAVTPAQSVRGAHRRIEPEEETRRRRERILEDVVRAARERRGANGRAVDIDQPGARVEARRDTGLRGRGKRSAAEGRAGA